MKIPCPFDKKYLPYQEEGIRLMHGCNMLLADEMGLGKTVQAIGVINASPGIQCVLIVCPKSLKLNWLSELDTWLVRSDGFMSGAPRIDVVTYEGLAKLDAETEWDLLIVDEAHYAKNGEAKRTQRLLSVAKRCTQILLLTGTPIQSRPVELWTLLRMVAPEEFDPPGRVIVKGKSVRVEAGGNAGFWPFVNRYCDAKKVKHGKGFGPSAWHWDFSGASNLAELNTRIQPFMLRRMKKDVLTQLPDKRRRIIALPSTVDDSDLLPELSDLTYEQAVRKLYSDKVLFEEWSKRRKEQGIAKVPQVVEYVRNALEETDKVIVFAHHQDVVDALSLELDDYIPMIVTGRSHEIQREQAVKCFQEDHRFRVFIGSIGAAGVGLTLTAASHVIFAELDPVPGRMAQAEDRAHRIGQKDSVLVDHLVWDRSLDARMAKILVRKQGIISKALDSSEERV